MSATPLTPRVLFVGKYGLDDTAGNAVAIRRLTASLEAFDVRVRYVQAGPATDQSAGEAAMALFGFEPTVVHALHAGTAAELGAALARAFGVPLVVTVTGTDLNGVEGGDGVRERLQRADAIVALTEAQLGSLHSLAPAVKAVRIPQAVVFGEEPFSLREALEVIAGRQLAKKRIALLAGGLRPVKGQLFAIDAFEAGSAQLGDWLLVIAGPALQDEYAGRVRARAQAAPGAFYIGEIDHESMLAAMGECDVLVNSSESEGEPQIILEAQCAGLPVLARRVPGNVSLVEDGMTGWLFDTASELVDLLVGHASEPARRESVIARAREARADRLDASLEASRHVDLYRALA